MSRDEHDHYPQFSSTGNVPDLDGLMREYADTLGSPHAREAIVRQIADLPHPFIAPDGALFVGYPGARAAGMVAIKSPNGPSCCEMKHLFVLPGLRTH